LRVAQASQVVRRPREEVFAFHADAANLSRVMPFGLIRTIGPSRLGPGRTVRVRVGVGRFAASNDITVKTWAPPRLFVDAQRYGPFASWEHVHEFLDSGATTEVRDRVSFALVPPLAFLEPVATHLVRGMLAVKLLRTARALDDAPVARSAA
jgi:ligand-binding SRPBCC domain-containing protein